MTRPTAFKLKPAKISITEDEILADLRYPERPKRPVTRRARGVRR